MLHSPSSPVETIAPMQGTLWKWTNYLSGWQPRWFVLEGGSLTYYLSPNEVHLGSRGSLKLSSCDILVHPSDHQRVDMVMPGGRHIYLRAASMSERQQWLLAFGVAKQGALDFTDSKAGGVHGSGKSAAGSGLQVKVETLHNTCELLVNQITSIKTMVTQPASIDPEALSGLSSDVATTCDNFLNTLHECMDLSLETQQLSSALKPLPLKELYAPKKGGGLSPVSKLTGFSESDLYPVPPPPTPASASHSHPPQRHTPTTPTLSTPTPRKTLPAHLTNLVAASDGSGRGTLSYARPSQDEEGVVVVSTDVDGKHPIEGISPAESCKQHSRNQSTLSNSDHFITPSSSPRLTPPSSPILSGGRRPLRIGDRVGAGKANRGRKHETFFSSLPEKFQNLELLEGAKEGEELVPSEQFLQSCEAVLPFFDMLSATAFAPVKADIGGNIKKLRAKYAEDCEAYSTLQAMVLSEIEADTCQAKNSATDALLWLKRAMEFVQHFIAEVSGGEHSLDVAAGKAYGLSLRRYHGWIVRGVFNLAMKAVPYHRDFLRVLGSLGTEEGERQVTADMAAFAASLGEIVLILNHFYQKHNLDPPPATQ